MKNDKLTITIDETNINNGQDKGGATGSVAVQVQNKTYQYKKSIKSNSLWSRIKNKFKTKSKEDKENYTEFVLAGLVQKALNEEGGPELAPEVLLVEGKPGAVASRYLSNEGYIKPLWEAAGFQGYNTPHRETIDITKVKSNLGVDSDRSHLKQDLCNCLATAMLIGNQDINSGNLLVTKHNSQYRIGLIDHGKGANTLLKYSGNPTYGGGIHNKNNSIIDFINSDTVVSMKKERQKSKLWECYNKDIIISNEMVKSLEKIAQLDYEEAIDSRIEELKNQYNKCNNNADKENILESLSSIDFTDQKTINKDYKEYADINTWFDNKKKDLKEIFKKRQEEMLDAAKLMKIQLEIQEAIKSSGKLENTKKKS